MRPKCGDCADGTCRSPYVVSGLGLSAPPPPVTPDVCEACPFWASRPSDPTGAVRARLDRQARRAGKVRVRDAGELAGKVRRCREAKAEGRPCTEFTAVPAKPPEVKPVAWQTAVTTCAERLTTTLPPTLESLAAAGFGEPWLFADGVRHDEAITLEDRTGLHVTAHYPALRIHGNWLAALQQLYLRDSFADRYAIFQDDLTAVRDLREYLERSWPGDKVYLNLLTWADNERVVRDRPPGWYEASLLNPGQGGQVYHGKQQQTGRGAVALVFDNEGVRALLSHPHMVNRSRGDNPSVRWRKVDGGVVEAMNQAGWREMISNPSLVQHMGEESTIRLPGNPRRPIRQARTFPGQDFSALSLLAVGSQNAVGKGQ